MIGLSGMSTAHEIPYVALACLIAGGSGICGAVVAVLKPDGQHARHGLVDVLVPVRNTAPIVAQHLVQDLHEGLILAQDDSAAAQMV